MKWKMLIVCLLVLFVSADAFAIGRGRFRRRSYSRTYSAPANCYYGTDQERCYAEALYMSQNRIFGHVGATIGNFEGWGYGGANCATCTPRGGMTLTGDAWVGGFRVRSWR